MKNNCAACGDWFPQTNEWYEREGNYCRSCVRIAEIAVIKRRTMSPKNLARTLLTKITE